MLQCCGISLQVMCMCTAEINHAAEMNISMCNLFFHYRGGGHMFATTQVCHSTNWQLCQESLCPPQKKKIGTNFWVTPNKSTVSTA